MTATVVADPMNEDAWALHKNKILQDEIPFPWACSSAVSTEVYSEGMHEFYVVCFEPLSMRRKDSTSTRILLLHLDKQLPARGYTILHRRIQKPCFRHPYDGRAVVQRREEVSVRGGVRLECDMF